MPETKNNVYNIFVYELVLFVHTFIETYFYGNQKRTLY